MKELYAWVDRMNEMKIDADTAAFPASIKTYRISSPSALDFDDSLVRIEDCNQEVTSFGTFPSRMSSLHFADPSADVAISRAVATQLGAVLTFASNRKIQVSANDMAIGMEGSSFTTFLPSLFSERELLGPVEADIRGTFEGLLRQLIGLPIEHRESIGAAIDLHNAAVQLYETDTTTAHMLTIAGIETLSAHFDVSEPLWEEYDEYERFDRSFDEIELTEGQRTLLRIEILKNKQLKLRQRFASYASSRVGKTFWDEPIRDFVPNLEMRAETGSTFIGVVEGETIPMENYVPRDPEVFRRRLLATYDARSKYVHVGAKVMDSMTSLQATVGIRSDKASSIEFAGTRRILACLIRAELATHSTPAELPNLRLQHGSS